MRILRLNWLLQKMHGWLLTSNTPYTHAPHISPVVLGKTYVQCNTPPHTHTPFSPLAVACRGWRNTEPNDVASFIFYQMLRGRCMMGCKLATATYLFNVYLGSKRLIVNRCSRDVSVLLLDDSSHLFHAVLLLVSDIWCIHSYSLHGPTVSASKSN